MLQGHLESPHVTGGNWGSLLATLVSFIRELRMDSEGSFRRIFMEVKRKIPGQGRKLLSWGRRRRVSENHSLPYHMVGGGGGEQLQRKRLSKSRVFRKVCPGHNQYPQNEKEKKWEKERRKEEKGCSFPS